MVMLSVQSEDRSIDLLKKFPEENFGQTKMLSLRRAMPTLAKNAFLDFPYAVYVGANHSFPTHNLVNARRNYSESCEEPRQNLLRFPAFPLKDTMEKFLKTVEPLLNQQELAQTKMAAEEFLKTDGARLQALLEKVAEKEENWLANRWQRVAYFQYRDPVTVFSSPGMTFPLQKFNNQSEYIDYTSKLIFGMLKYKELIDNNKIPIVKMGKLELDNSQFKRVFGTCRIPKPEEDTIEYHPNSKHIVILHKNHFFKFDVYNQNNEILSPQIIFKELKNILEKTQTKGTAFGILSTDHRDIWAKSYEELSRCNELASIQQALFTVSLDEDVPAPKGEELNVQAGQLIHGGGSKQNAGNRWMDKTIQLCVNPNGASGFTYEHSPAEGQPIAMIVDYVIQNFNSKSFFDGGAMPSDYKSAQPLVLKSSPSLEDYISKAGSSVDKLANDLQMHVLVYEGYGKEFLKQQKLSPDSFIQIALQYAFYAMYGVPGAAYESAHLRVYNGGRTETIRSCSNEGIAFAKAMCTGDKQNAADLLRKAVETHRKYTMDALMGRGVDRHLLGLKLMALEHKLPIPEFYKCPGVAKSAHFRLSTSQVASKYKTFMCYGPLTDDGYGCCYNPRDSSMIFAISSWRSNKETCSSRFARALTEALDMMRLTLQTTEKAGSKL